MAISANKSFTPFFTTVIEGKTAEVFHRVRRGYGVAIDGKTGGHLASDDPLNAAARIATVDKLADL